MSGLWVVRLTEQNIAYGPLADYGEAGGVARWLTAEVDPAEVLRLRSPVLALLSGTGAATPDSEHTGAWWAQITRTITVPLPVRRSHDDATEHALGIGWKWRPTEGTCEVRLSPRP